MTCPVLAEVIQTREMVNLREGATSTMQFHLQWQPNPFLQSMPFYTIRFDNVDQPFWVFDRMNPDGFNQFNQSERFDIRVIDNKECSLSVSITIHDVCIEDEGSYILTLIVYHHKGHDDYLTIDSIKDVSVYTPPQKARCFIAISDWIDHPYEVHCHAIMGRGNASLSCFQDDIKLAVKDSIFHSKKIRYIFWMMTGSPVSCCSHSSFDIVRNDSCTDFQWPFKKYNHIVSSPIPKIGQNNESIHVTVHDEVNIDTGSSGGCTLTKSVCHSYIIVSLFLVSLVAISE